MEKSVEQLTETQPNAFLLLNNSLKKKRLAHAYLFEGSKGTGKRAMGMVLAQTLLCQNESAALGGCGVCLNCKRIESLNHPDVYLVEPDGLSIKKEQIKSLHEAFQKKSLESNKKVFLIDAAEKMTVSAANSLLKFLEEPHEGTTIVLMTEQPHRILPTILSRCQMVSFKQLDSKRFAAELEENGVSASCALLITHLTSDLDEACKLGLDDQFVLTQEVAMKLFTELSHSTMAALLIIQENWMTAFKEREQHELGLDLLLLIVRDLLWLQLNQEDRVLNKGFLKELKQESQHYTKGQLAETMAVILEAKQKLGTNMNPQLLMEQLVLKIDHGV